MSEQKHMFIIQPVESVAKSWARDASSFAEFLGLIGIGVWLDSSAMQWAGFLLAVIILFGKASVMPRVKMTADEARKRINEIEAE